MKDYYKTQVIIVIMHIINIIIIIIMIIVLVHVGGLLHSVVNLTVHL